MTPGSDRPKESGETTVRIQESSPKGGAFFSDGGVAHLTSLNSYLNKLRDHIESETKQDVESEGKQARVGDKQLMSTLEGTRKSLPAEKK